MFYIPLYTFYKTEKSIFLNFQVKNKKFFKKNIKNNKNRPHLISIKKASIYVLNFENYLKLLY